MDFGHNGGTIGRSLESDWVLPDGQRYLSSRHASIDFRSGSYYVVDTSTNGVYVNDAEQPVGRGNPQRLFTGDRVRIGEYEMSVEITDEDDTRETLANDRHIDPVSRAQRVPPPDPTRADMVAPHEITAVGIEMLIDEEAEASQIQRLNKANAASLRLEDDFSRTNPQATPTPASEAEASERPARHRTDFGGTAAAAPKTRRAAARQRGRAHSCSASRHRHRPATETGAAAAPAAKPTPPAAAPLGAVARRILSRRRLGAAAPRRQAGRPSAAPPRADSCARSCSASARTCTCVPSRRTSCACRRRRSSRRTTIRSSSPRASKRR